MNWRSRNYVQTLSRKKPLQQHLFIYSNIVEIRTLVPRVLSVHPTLDFTQIWTWIQCNFVDPRYRDLAWRMAHQILPTKMCYINPILAEMLRVICARHALKHCHLFYECNFNSAEAARAVKHRKAVACHANRSWNAAPFPPTTQPRTGGMPDWHTVHHSRLLQTFDFDRQLCESFPPATQHTTWKIAERWSPYANTCKHQSVTPICVQWRKAEQLWLKKWI